MNLEMLLPLAISKLKEDGSKGFIFAVSENKEGYSYCKKKYDVVLFCDICERLLKENGNFAEAFTRINKELKNG